MVGVIDVRPIQGNQGCGMKEVGTTEGPGKGTGFGHPYNFTNEATMAIFVVLGFLSFYITFFEFCGAQLS